MAFAQELSRLMDASGMTGRDIAAAAGLSPALISRYRSGERTPAQGSDVPERLARALSSGGLIDEAEAAAALRAAAEPGQPEAVFVSEHFSALLDALAIPPGELARFLSYDASYISRIRTGQRRPADPEAFADGVSRFAARRAGAPDARAHLAALLGCAQSELADPDALAARLRAWLCTGETEQRAEPVGDFLTKLSEFDLNAYIQSIHFDDIKTPTVPFQLPTSRSYYGLEAMKSGELDFLRSTVLSRSGGPVFMCSDMPMEDMAQDLEFGKKWMFGLAAMLKKGLHLSMIHNLDRPFAEMMLGLESWIPLYMTGQVHPYYLPGAPGSVYRHLLYVSGAAALSGECVAGQHARGKYELARGREAVAYARARADDLLAKAQPLMEIFRAPDKARFDAFLRADALDPGPRHYTLSVPPLHTASAGLLREILSRSALSADEQAAALACAEAQRALVEQVLAHSPMLVELRHLTRAEFDRAAPALSLPGLFWETRCRYTYEQYEAHLSQTAEFAAAHAGYRARFDLGRGFSGIQISVHEGKWAMVSKATAPAIHFVIRHPKLRAAIENMTLPVVEAE